MGKPEDKPLMVIKIISGNLLLSRKLKFLTVTFELFVLKIQSNLKNHSIHRLLGIVSPDLSISNIPPSTSILWLVKWSAGQSKNGSKSRDKIANKRAFTTLCTISALSSAKGAASVPTILDKTSTFSVISATRFSFFQSAALQLKADEMCRLKLNWASRATRSESLNERQILML